MTNTSEATLGDAERSYLEKSADHYSHELRHRADVSNQLGQAALKSLMLVNGGAIIALLTFIGNKGELSDPALIKDAMRCFGVGLFSTLFAYHLAYYSQNAFMFFSAAMIENANRKLGGSEPDLKPQNYVRNGTIALYGAVALTLISLGFFVGGALTAMNGIL